MDTPSELEAAAEDQEDIVITNREYEGANTVVVDFGPGAGDLSLDVVEGIAIVVTGAGQFEFAVPEEADEITVNDGILTIRE